MNNYDLLFQIIRSGFYGEPIDNETKELLTDEYIDRLFSVAKKHDITPVLAYCLQVIGVSSQKKALSERCLNEQLKAVYRCENMKHELQNICRVFEDAKINCIILKGSVIRNLYPEEWLRTSCDIDILVKEENLNKAIELLTEKLNYTYTKKGSHDVSLFSPNGINLELHYILVENNHSIGSNNLLFDVWDYTQKADGFEYCLKMNYDMLLFYHISHLCKHLKTGGCGIKPFLDLYILTLNRPLSDRLSNMLEQGSTIQAYTLSKHLSEVWFGKKEHNEQTERLSKYVLSGGVYGNLSNRVALNQNLNGGSFKYAVSRIFLPYDTLIFRYPNLEGKKYLMPYYSVKRWFDLLFKGSAKSSFKELKINSTLSQDDVNETVKMWNDLNL